MNLRNYYYYFQSALTPRLCDEIIEYGKRHKPEIAVTGGAELNDQNVKKDGTLKKSVLKKLHVKRKSDIVWTMTHGCIKKYAICKKQMKSRLEL